MCPGAQLFDRPYEAQEQRYGISPLARTSPGSFDAGISTLDSTFKSKGLLRECRHGRVMAARHECMALPHVFKNHSDEESALLSEPEMGMMF